MNKAITIMFIGILLIASFFIGYSIKESGSTSSEIQNLQKQIPSSVLTKYEELEPTYKKSLGTEINLCTRNDEKIYIVSGSGGVSGIIFYYTEEGVEIGSHSWTDAIDPNNLPPKPPVNTQEYNCTIIKGSEQFVNE